MAERREPQVMVSPIPEERVALYGRHFRGGTESDETSSVRAQP